MRPLSMTVLPPLLPADGVVLALTSWQKQPEGRPTDTASPQRGLHGHGEQSSVSGPLTATACARSPASFTSRKLESCLSVLVSITPEVEGRKGRVVMILETTRRPCACTKNKAHFLIRLLQSPCDFSADVLRISHESLMTHNYQNQSPIFLE